jgi:hypothetical protein
MHCLHCCRHSASVVVVQYSIHLNACARSEQQVLTLFALARHCTAQEDQAPAAGAAPAAANGDQHVQEAVKAGAEGELEQPAVEAVAALAMQEQAPAVVAQRQSAWARFGDAPSAMKLLLLSVVGLVIGALLFLCCELWLGWSSEVCELQQLEVQ